MTLSASLSVSQIAPSAGDRDPRRAGVGVEPARSPRPSRREARQQARWTAPPIPHCPAPQRPRRRRDDVPDPRRRAVSELNSGRCGATRRCSPRSHRGPRWTRTTQRPPATTAIPVGGPADRGSACTASSPGRGVRPSGHRGSPPTATLIRTRSRPGGSRRAPPDHAIARGSIAATEFAATRTGLAPEAVSFTATATTAASRATPPAVISAAAAHLHPRGAGDREGSAGRGLERRVLGEDRSLELLERRDPARAQARR